jgi:restriction endonuclease S subunit
MTDLPVGWERAPLDEIAQIQGGIQKQMKRRPDKNPFPFLRVANVTASGLDLNEVHNVELFGDEIKRFRLVRGDLLVVEGNGSPDQVGRAAIWDGSIPDAVHQNHLIRVRPGPRILPEYLGLVWNAPETRERLTSVSSSTSGLHTLSVSKLKGFELPLPSLYEQRRITEILDDHLSRLEAAIRLVAASRRRLDRLSRSLKQRAIERPGSPMTRLGDLVERVEAGRSLGGSAPPAGPDEWGIIKVSAMTWGEFRQSENKRIDPSQADPCFEIHPGDILVSRANTSAYVGASVLVDHVRPRLLLSDKSLRLVPLPGVEPEWLNEVLQAPVSRRRLSAMATGTKDSMRNISQKSLLSLAVPNTTSGEQYAVVAACRVASGITSALGLSICRTQARSNALRRSLLAAAFTGRLTGGSSDMDQVEELAGV